MRSKLHYFFFCLTGDTMDGGIFSGECHLGPMAGKFLAHPSRSYKLYRPMLAFSMNPQNTPVEAVEIGEYRFEQSGYDKYCGRAGSWYWRETDEGRAYRKLFD